ncbi:MAG: helix-turn-helix domain-containing protein [Planctomycetes bacterium]|nr:helix-turn-helix domain-containing protein [Planctomycetota bacterium]
MITNERQYRVTKTQLEKLRGAIRSFDVVAATEHLKSSVLAKAELAALRSECEALSQQIQEYETLKSGTVEILKASSLEALPQILIRARIAKGLSQRELAEAVGLKEQQIQRYEAGEYASASIRRLADIAAALGLNVSEVAEFNTVQEKRSQTHTSDLAWDQFPIKEMYRRSWFEDFCGTTAAAVANSEELVKQFVADAIHGPVRAAARQRVRSGGLVDWYALLAWQCRVIALAKKETLQGQYQLGTITDDWFVQLLRLSRANDGPKAAIDYLRRSNIRVVLEPRLQQTHLDGAAFLLSDGSPIIGLTLRYDRLDNFWFVLIHELVHVREHLHEGDIESIFDDLDAQADDVEQAADNLASEILVPSAQWESALARYVRSKEVIENFAEQLGIHPAIVAGKIRREADNYTILVDMVGQGEVRKLFPEIHFA